MHRGMWAIAYVIAIWAATQPSLKARTPDVVLYSSIWTSDIDDNGDLTVYGSATVEKTNCTDTVVEVQNVLRDPSFNAMDTSFREQGTCYKEAYTQADLTWDNSPEGDYNSQGHAWVEDEEYGCVLESMSAGKFAARWKYNQRLPGGDYEYVRSTASCNGVCEGTRKCHSQLAAWLGQKGWFATAGPLAGCLGHLIPTSAIPPCTMPFGAVIFSQDHCSS